MTNEIEVAVSVDKEKLYVLEGDLITKLRQRISWNLLTLNVLRKQ